MRDWIGIIAGFIGIGVYAAYLLAMLVLPLLFGLGVVLIILRLVGCV